MEEIANKVIVWTIALIHSIISSDYDNLVNLSYYIVCLTVFCTTGYESVVQSKDN